MNLYVGNLQRAATESDLRPLFEPFGNIKSVSVLKDKFSGESRGFGFVEMSTSSEGEAAIKALDGKDLLGQAISVKEARPKSDIGSSFGGGSRGSSGGYGGGGRGGRRY